MASNYVDLPIESGSGSSGVSSLNSLTGALTLVGGTGITITPSGSSITISSTGGGTGTVTSVSVVSANGFAGTVTNPTTIPALTLTTSITGVLKGNGTAISAATAGTDYVIPSGSITGTASNVTATSNSTLTTLSALSLPYSQVTGAPGGSVTSVGLSVPGILYSVSGSPITTAGTIALSLNTQTANTVFAGPSSGSAAVPSFRAIVSADVPTLNQNTTGTSANITGTAVVLNGGTGATNFTAFSVITAGSTSTSPMTNVSGLGTVGQLLTSAGVGALPVWSGNLALNYFFGDGSDGNVTISSGTTTLTRDMFYNNLTIGGTGSLITNSFHVYVLETLDITAAPANGITSNGGAGGSGTSAGGAGAAGTGPSVSGLLPFPSAANAGGTSTNTTGSPGGGSGNTSGFQGGGTGAGGNGGTGAGGAGGTGTGAIAQNGYYPLKAFAYSFTRLAGGNLITFISTGRSNAGGGGGGSGSAVGGGGGGSGSGGGWVWLSAFNINRGASTAVGAISAKGGLAGNGGSGTNASSAGGGGGSGGGGGVIYMSYYTLSGSSATNALDASGGNGGAGGNSAAGATSGGAGGGSGGAGTITIINLNTNVVTTAVSGSGNAGTAASGLTGGPGGTGITQQVSL